MANGYNATGTVISIGEVENPGGGNFTKREIVIGQDGKYPNFIKFEVHNDNCPRLDEFEDGDLVSVDFDLRGREWNGKYFVNLVAWRIKTVGAEKEPPQEPLPVKVASTPAPKQPEPVQANLDGSVDEVDDENIPF